MTRQVEADRALLWLFSLPRQGQAQALHFGRH